MELTIEEIAAFLGGNVSGDDQIIITGVNSIEEADTGDISFFFDKRYKTQLKNTKASALLVAEITNEFNGPQITVPDPRIAQAKIADMFTTPIENYPGISQNTLISETASIGDNVSIYPNVYIGEGAVIGKDVILYPGVFIGNRVSVGDGSILYPNVIVMHNCIIGKNVIIHGGTMIGSDGFGFIKDGSQNIKVPQLGIVQIDDNVEIGANNCIDRATFGKTRIKSGVKTDNLIQIAHNVVIGENTMIAAQTGISGSVEIGKDVIMGGQVGVIDHLKIGDRVIIGPGGGVYQSIKADEIVSGCPTMPHKLFLKVSRLLFRIPGMFDRLKILEKKVERLDNPVDME